MSEAAISEANPYSAPDADLDSGQGAATYQPKIFSFQGRLGRLRYLAYGFALSIVMNLAMIPFMGAAAFMGGMGANPEGMGMLGGVLMMVVAVVSLVFAIMWLKRRLNDLNRSGWWLLLMFIPVVNILLAIYLLFFPGTDGPNNFGPAPAANSIGVLILAWLGIGLFVLGIASAILMPMMLGVPAQ